MPLSLLQRGDTIPPTESTSPGSVGNWSAVLVLVLFALSNVVIIFPLRATIPHVITTSATNLLVNYKIMPSRSRPYKTLHLHFNFITVPLAAVLILLASKAIDGTVVKSGIVGADGVKPINIMALFISLAYLAISLDFTGLLRFSAFWVARKGGPSGKRLYLYLYLFFLTCGAVVGNDPVILSGTAFLAYFTRVTGIVPPTAWIFSQFAAANIASVVLVSSNPTNLVLSGAFGLSFVSYTAHVILPFLAAAVLVYPVIAFVLFRKRGLIPTTLGLELDDRSAGILLDRRGATFGSVLLLVTLAVLVGTSTVGVPVWEVTVPPAVTMLIRDAVHDWRSRHESQATSEIEDVPPTSPQINTTPTITFPAGIASYPSLVSQLQELFPTATTIVSRLPIALLPFAFLMFILVQALSSKGWVEVFVRWWAAWIAKTGTLGAIGGMGFLACILCNICGTNIGATILLARVLQVWLAATPDVAPRTRDGAVFALALGSNYGAFTLTFSASLAGLLWRQILREKGIHVRARQFLLLNVPIAAVAMAASSVVLVGQVYIVHRDT
ncbi:hypothetical protein PHLGIDRAFT_497949 [Phlebiopsis gigantea 11061_1 CR5-6]|uniref:Citrate transporter-like domain-containing protein n=1 Tax=Phlebiopsis gigantea (strain 11061_1 CR5-6) TaxID=745531 RepID=A0A0C3S4Y2_PHLG1|nr:hypothetical protein PHLGIDRAFT_497949 [Phlebiopsis gigantea 11061_1 CR5-6]